MSNGNTLLRLRIRDLLKEYLSYAELEEKTGSGWNKKGLSAEKWLAIKYSDDPIALGVILNWPLLGEEAVKEWNELKGGKRIEHTELFHSQRQWEGTLKNLGYHFDDSPTEDPDLDIAEEDLPDAWKKLLDEYDWVRGKGFKHRLYSKATGKDWWMFHTDLPGYDDIGIDALLDGITPDPRALKMARKVRKMGKVQKRRFAKTYQKHKSFFDGLTYVHWQGNYDKIKKLIVNPDYDDEISTTWFTDTPIKAGNQKVGLILTGRPTFVSNENLYSGYAGGISIASSADPDQFIPSLYMARGGHRDKSSGINRYPGTEGGLDIDGPKDVDQKRITRMRNMGLRGNNNEALIDNWRVSGIVLVPPIGDDLREKILKLADENEIPVFDQELKEI